MIIIFSSMGTLYEINTNFQRNLLYLYSSQHICFTKMSDSDNSLRTSKVKKKKLTLRIQGAIIGPLLLSTMVLILPSPLTISLPPLPGSVEDPSICEGWRANIFGTPGDDFLFGTAGNDVIVGFEGNDTIQGLDGSDFICGNDGNDFMDGGVGDDRMIGGSGNDQLQGNAGIDFMDGNADNDIMSGGPGDDRMIGGSGNDQMGGDDNNDTITGEGGDDGMNGGVGNDLLRGADDVIDNDNLDGGPDIDECERDPDPMINCELI
jgi:Ca2+-binding RTX toxin-like protein